MNLKAYRARGGVELLVKQHVFTVLRRLTDLVEFCLSAMRVSLMRIYICISYANQRLHRNANR